MSIPNPSTPNPSPRKVQVQSSIMRFFQLAQRQNKEPNKSTPQTPSSSPPHPHPPLAPSRPKEPTLPRRPDPITSSHSTTTTPEPKPIQIQHTQPSIGNTFQHKQENESPFLYLRYPFEPLPSRPVDIDTYWDSLTSILTRRCSSIHDFNVYIPFF